MTTIFVVLTLLLLKDVLIGILTSYGNLSPSELAGVYVFGTAVALLILFPVGVVMPVSYMLILEYMLRVLIGKAVETDSSWYSGLMPLTSLLYLFYMVAL